MWGRKWNLVLRGIPGKLDETPRVTEIKVRESFEKQLGISNERANVMLLTAVHRLLGGMDENKRNCIVRFSSLMDRDEVLTERDCIETRFWLQCCAELTPVRYHTEKQAT
jgi:hypothetical protein